MSFLKIVVAFKVVEVNWFPVIYLYANLITNSIHAWLTKDYRSSGMQDICFSYCQCSRSPNLEVRGHFAQLIK